MFPKYDDRPFFFHFNKNGYDNGADLKKLNGVTVCFMPEEEGNPNFSVGVAACCRADTFSKKIGRMISEGRSRTRQPSVRAGCIQELREEAKTIAEKTALGLSAK